MSIAVMTKVWASYPGAGSELLAMLALADWADDNGNCYPSMSAIAKKVRLSKSQAQRVVHGLIDDGYLKVTANALGGAPTQTRNYRIVLDRLTGSAHATQTVSEPSLTVKWPEQAPAPPKANKEKSGTTLKAFLESCKESREKPFAEDDAIFDYAEKVGIDNEMMAVAWAEFKARLLPTTKRQKDWRAHFRNAVRRNWYSLWFLKEGEVARWTTAGEQARRAAA